MRTSLALRLLERRSYYFSKLYQSSLASKRWSSSFQRQWSTPLAKTIADAIETAGPISIAAYMRQCLTSPDGGYYTLQAQGRDQFGQKGDFITSPEISQIFGELIGIWVVSEWMAQGRKSSGVELIEVGPGRGTLMDDVLRTIRNFKPLAASIECVYLVEASPSLREKQKQLLCGDAPMEETEIGFKCRSKYADIPIVWCEDIRFVPNESIKTPFILAHEFFDALPIHAFRSVPPSQPTQIQGLHGPISVSTSRSAQTPQWRELLVRPTPTPSSISTTSRPSLSSSKAQPDFQLSLAQASTPTSLVLPEASPRYKALKSKPESIIEISPESHSYAAEFAKRIGGSANGISSSRSTDVNPIKMAPSGAALIIDYGPSDTIPASTLRGIREHKLVSPFSSPGLVDVSADVDFTALVEAAVNASEGVEAHGPIEQGEWLVRMGIKERAKMLAETSQPGKDQSVSKAVERLIERGGGGMGRLYKVMAIVPEGGGRRRPVGFGGGVAE